MTRRKARTEPFYPAPAQDICDPAIGDAVALRCACEIVEAAIAEDLRGETIAAQIGCSGRRLERLFAGAFGLSVADYICLRRLQRAREQLLAAPPDTGVAPIAAACGFPRLADFVRLYVAVFGERPSATRAARADPR